MHRRDPAIAASLNRLNKERAFGRIPERIAQPADRGADALVKIHKHVLRPEGLSKFLAADDLTGTAQEYAKGAKGQVLYADLDAASAKFTRAEVSLKYTEADPS